MLNIFLHFQLKVTPVFLQLSYLYEIILTNEGPCESHDAFCDFFCNFLCIAIIIPIFSVILAIMSYYQSLFVTSFKESICVIKCIFEIFFFAFSPFFFQCRRSRWVVFLSSRHHTLWLYSGQSRCCSQSGRKELRSEY